MKHIILLLILFLFIPATITAEPRRLSSNLLIDFKLPSDRWQVSAAAPELAIKAMMVDLAHDNKKKGKEVDEIKLRSMAEKFVKTNNLYIYNEKTAAYLMISLAPFSEEAGPPDRAAIRRSAEWAVKAISEHAEVKNPESFIAYTSFISMPGIKYAAHIDANHPLFGSPHHFIGIIGYSHPYWVFIYYNDLVKESRDLEEMRQIISTISINKMK